MLKVMMQHPCGMEPNSRAVESQSRRDLLFGQPILARDLCRGHTPVLRGGHDRLDADARAAHDRSGLTGSAAPIGDVWEGGHPRASPTGMISSEGQLVSSSWLVSVTRTISSRRTPP